MYELPEEQPQKNAKRAPTVAKGVSKNGDKPKRRQAKTATELIRRQTLTAKYHNGDSQSGDKPKRRVSTDIMMQK